MVAADKRVLKDPEALVGIRELGDSAIVIAIRPWVSVPDYENLRIDLYRALVEAFRKNELDMPFPQREVRLIGQSAAVAS